MLGHTGYRDNGKENGNYYNRVYIYMLGYMGYNIAEAWKHPSWLQVPRNLGLRAKGLGV